MANCYASTCPPGKQCVPIAPNYYLYDCPKPPTPPPATTHPQPTIPYSSPGPVEKLTLNKRGGIVTPSSNPLFDFFGNIANEIKSIFTGGGGEKEIELQPRGIFDTRKSVEEALSEANKKEGIITSAEKKGIATSINLFGKEYTISNNMLYGGAIVIMIIILIIAMRR